MIYKTILFVLFFSTCLVLPAFGQEDAPSDTLSVSYKIYVVVKNDGTQYMGKILHQDAREVLIETKEIGQVYIPKHEIKEIREVESLKEYVKGTAYMSNRMYSKYFLFNSAIPLEKEDNYMHLYYYLGGEAQFAISENFSLGVATSFLASPLVITPRYGKKVADKLYLGVSAYLGWASWINLETTMAAGFGTITFGDKNNNISLNIGYGGVFVPGDIYTPKYPIVSLGNHTRIGRAAFLNFEAMFFNTDELLAGAIFPSVRWVTKKNSAWDFGLTGVFYENKVNNFSEFLPVPLPTVKFSKFFN